MKPNLLLNVGSANSKDVPSLYRLWQQDSLDIDPEVKPDIVCDAREMRRLPPSHYDAVYCSHCLEHFHRHEVSRVLEGFAHVLKPTGFTHVIVPNMQAVFDTLVHGKRDLHDTFYISAGGPITFHDVIYGWGKQVSTGNQYYCHKTGFTERSLAKALKSHFKVVMTATDHVGNLYAFAFKQKPSRERMRLLGI